MYYVKYKFQAIKQLLTKFRRRILGKHIVLATIILCLIVGIGLGFFLSIDDNNARAFTGVGQGTVVNPYQIDSCDLLQEISLDPTKNYILVDDIDCTETITWNGGQGFLPIEGLEGFQLDGRNHTITNIFMDRDTPSLALFSSIYQTSTIKNINLTGGSIRNRHTGDSSSQKTASLVAFNGGNVSGVTSSVNIRATGTVGGLVAQNTGSLNSTSSTGTILVDGTWNSSVGGLVGKSVTTSYSLIGNSFSTSNIVVTDDGIGWSYNCGGLVGEASGNSNLSYIFYSYAAGDVNCEYDSTIGAGGLVGTITGTTIVDSFSTGRVYGNGPQYGGLVGKKNDSNSLATSYYDVTTSQQTNCVNPLPTDCNGINNDGLSPNYFKNNTTNPPLSPGWDFASAWQSGAGLPQFRPASISPEKPQNVSVQAYGTKLSLSWDAPLNDGGSPLTGYKIQYKKHTDIYWINYVDEQVDTSVEIIQLLPSTEYDIQVIALNDVGSGIPSDTVTPTTLSTGISPPSNLSPSAITYDSLTLNWSEPQNNSGEVVTSYQIDYRQNSYGSWTSVSQPTANGLSRNFTALQSGSDYQFRVAASTQNQQSAWSDILTSTTNEVPEKFSVAYSVPRAVQDPPLVGNIITIPPNTLDYTVTLTYSPEARTSLDEVLLFMGFPQNVSVSGGTADNIGTFDLPSSKWNGLIQPGQTIQLAVTTSEVSMAFTNNVCTSFFSAAFETNDVPLATASSPCYYFTLLYPQTDFGMAINQEGETPQKIGDLLRYKVTTTNIEGNNISAINGVPRLRWNIVLPIGYSYQSTDNNQANCVPTAKSTEKYLEFSGRIILECLYTVTESSDFKVGDKIEFTISGVVDNTIFMERKLTIEGLIQSDRDAKGYQALYYDNDDGIGLFDYPTNNVASYTTALPETFISPAAVRDRLRSSGDRVTTTGTTQAEENATPNSSRNEGGNEESESIQTEPAIKGAEAVGLQKIVDRLARLLPASAAKALPYGLIAALMAFALIYFLEAASQYRQQRNVARINRRIIQTNQSADEFINMTTHYLNTPLATMNNSIELSMTSKSQVSELLHRISSKLSVLSRHIQKLVDANIHQVKGNTVPAIEKNTSYDPLLNRRVLLPIFIVLLCLAGSNALFIGGNVYDLSKAKLFVEAAGFILVCLLFILSYQYRERFKKNVRLEQDLRTEETNLLAQRQVFIVDTYKKLADDYQNLQELSKELTPSKQTTLFRNGLDQLGSLTKSLGGISHYMNTGSEATVIDVSRYLTMIVQQYSESLSSDKLSFVSEIQDGIFTSIQVNELHQLISSAIDNAIKFMPNGGKISVTLKKNKKQILMSISDTGIGISKEKLPSILEPFTRGTDSEQYDFDGIGLDLYTDKVILSKLGGDIQIKSKENHGTTVTYILNLYEVERGLAPTIITPTSN